jgi:hypothetical protein
MGDDSWDLERWMTLEHGWEKTWNYIMQEVASTRWMVSLQMSGETKKEVRIDRRSDDIQDGKTRINENGMR